MKSVIYFLYQEDKIKIGKTTNLNQRIKSLTSTWGEFDLNKSFFIEINNKELSRLEKTMHFLFRNYKIKNLPQKQGFNEFFKLDIKDTLKVFLDKFLIELRTDIKYINYNKIKKTSIKKDLFSLTCNVPYIYWRFDKDFNIDFFNDLNINNLFTIDRNYVHFYIPIESKEDELKLKKSLESLRALSSDYINQINESFDIILKIDFYKFNKLHTKFIYYSKIKLIEKHGCGMEIFFENNSFTLFYYNKDLSYPDLATLPENTCEDFDYYETFLDLFFEDSEDRTNVSEKLKTYYNNYGRDPYDFYINDRVIDSYEAYTKKINIGIQSAKICNYINLDNN